VKAPRVTLRQLFAGQQLAGLTPHEYEGMTDAERQLARLKFIAARADFLAKMPHQDGAGLPANIHAEAGRLHKAARTTLQRLQGDDVSLAVASALAVGQGLERIQAQLAIASLLDVTDKLSKAEPDIRRGKKVHDGAKEAADLRNAPFKAKWPEYQKDVDDKKQRNPALSYAEICRQVAIKHKVSEKTITRNTTNPARK
tara:strand:- start:7227 stop:7823 length:597 start_codon:yes stop_codon:yes gene_type:complete